MPEPGDDHRDREHRFRGLYQEHYAAIRAYAVRRLASDEDVADVVADVFTTAWRRLDDVPPPPADRLWLYGTARRVVAGRHRSLRRHLGLMTRLTASLGRGGEDRAGEDQAGPADDQVIRALDVLRPAEREALTLVVWDQLSHAEAARVLGCSQNAVAIRVHRARARLRAALSPASQAPAERVADTTPTGTRDR